MINGYVTFDELLLITGLKHTELFILLRDGVAVHELSHEPLVKSRNNNCVQRDLFNLDEVMNWLSIHIY